MSNCDFVSGIADRFGRVKAGALAIRQCRAEFPTLANTMLIRLRSQIRSSASLPCDASNRSPACRAALSGSSVT